MAEAKAYKMIPHCTKDTITYEMDELVRCKDCKYFNTNGCDEGFGWCERNGVGHGSTSDWFCADGRGK